MVWKSNLGLTNQYKIDPIIWLITICDPIKRAHCFINSWWTVLAVLRTIGFPRIETVQFFILFLQQNKLTHIYPAGSVKNQVKADDVSEVNLEEKKNNYLHILNRAFSQILRQHTNWLF